MNEKKKGDPLVVGESGFPSKAQQGIKAKT